MALVELTRKPVGRVFGMKSVDGKNPEIKFLGFDAAPTVDRVNEDGTITVVENPNFATVEELLTSKVIKNNDTILRRLLADVVNDELFKLAINPFLPLRPATMADEQWDKIETAAKALVSNLALTPEKAVKVAIASME